MGSRAVFGPEELRWVRGARSRAQDLTGQFFALPNDWFARTSHEVCTRRELRGFEVLGEGRLAQIRRVFRLGACAPERWRRCPHYRICLQDHNLLERAERDGSVSLPDLLTGVLTHEYVHLVRFCRLEHPYGAPPGRQRDEERRVCEVTRTILARHGSASLRRLAGRLGPADPGPEG